MNKIIYKFRVLSVFDFDGTLTYHDSLFPFLYFAFSKKYFLKCLIRMVPSIFYFICCRLTREKLKKILIKSFLTNIREEWLCKTAERFCEKYWIKLMRPSGILKVVEEVNSGAEVTICSASPTFLLEPFAKKLNVKLIGTELEIKNGKLTGNIIGQNCRCIQKVLRLREIYGNLDAYYLRVWGDTRSDRELLKIAQDPHWRHFHDTKEIWNFFDKIT